MYSVLWECFLSSRNASIYHCLCSPDLHNAAPRRIARDEGEACEGDEGKSDGTGTPNVRALLSLSVPKCGEIKLRSFAAELLLVHYGEENMSAICYISCDCHMTSFPIDWSIEKVRT